jgi:TolB-like protein
MKRIHLIMALAIPLAVSGCNHWRPVSVPTWENGHSASAAQWKAHGGRDLLDKITVRERVNTHLPTVDANYVRTAYNAISHLLATARPAMGNHTQGTQGLLDDNGMVGHDTFDPTRPVLYSTTVNLNDYARTTNFGRLMSEALATAMTQHWRSRVINMNVRQGSIPIEAQQGEFLLSRDARQLALDYNAGAVLVSTYSVAIDKVYINVELVNVHHNAVVAAVMFDIPKGPRTEALLKGIEQVEPRGTFLSTGR